LIGWTAVLFSIQGWLAETPAQKATASTPAYLSVGMGLLSLGVVRTSRVLKYPLAAYWHFGRHTCRFSCRHNQTSQVSPRRHKHHLLYLNSDYSFESELYTTLYNTCYTKFREASSLPFGAHGMLKRRRMPLTILW